MESSKDAIMSDAKESKSVPVEDLPLAERVKLADTVNAYEGIGPGWFVDAKDTVDTWCVGNVLRADSGDAMINYDGWSSKFDVCFKLKSPKVAPFRLFSHGYTGQVRVPIRKLAFSLSQLEEVTCDQLSLHQNKKKLEQVIESNFKCLETPTEITQYLRGRLYIYVDLLLTNEYIEPDKEVPPVVGFLGLVVRLIAMWLGRFPDLLKSFAECQTHPKLILVDRNAALAACGCEILDMLKWLFCLCPRTLLFFAVPINIIKEQRYDVDVDKASAKFTKEVDKDFVALRDKAPSFDILRDKLILESEMVYGLFINLFNEFCFAGGLEAVNNIVNAEKLAAKAAAAGIPGYKLPLDMMATILFSLKSIKAVAKPELCKEIATNGKVSFFQRIQALDDKDIKELNKDQVVASMFLMRGFLKLIHSDEEVSKMIQTHEMLLSLKFLQSQTLEKRINGLTDIKKMIDRVELPGDPGWFTAEYLTMWIVHNSVLEKTLNDYTHPELIRRTSHILLFLAKHGAVTTAMMELLWKCQQDKHEDLVRAVYDTIKEIVEYLSEESISYINTQLSKYPPEAYDEKLITFTRDFTLRAYAAAAKKLVQAQVPAQPEAPAKKPEDDKKPMEEKKAESANNNNNIVVVPLPELPPEQTGKIERTGSGEVCVPNSESMYGLPRLWALLQDESPIQHPLLEQVTSSFRDIIAVTPKYRYQYLYLCMENLKNNRSAAQSFIVAVYIMQLLCGKSLEHRTSMTQLILKLNKDYSLIDIVISSFQHYEARVSEAVAKGLKQDKIAEAIVSGKYPHQTNLEIRFRFTTYALRHGGEEGHIGKERLLKLWNLFVEEGNSVYDTQQFLKWVTSENEVAAAAFKMLYFSPAENQFLLELLARSRTKLADTEALSYHKYLSNLFILVNAISGNAEFNKVKLRVLKFETIIGLDALWENVCASTAEAARASLSSLLIDVYTSHHESLFVQRKDIVSSFIDRCMQTMIKLESAHDSVTIIGNTVKLLQQFFDFMDGKKYDESEVVMTQKFVITLANFPDTGNVSVENMDKRQVDVDINVNLGQIRWKAAQLFHIPFLSVQLASTKGKYSPEEDDLRLRNVGWVHHIVVRRLPGDTSSESPKAYLAQNQAYINHLFVLLAKESSPYVDAVWNLLTTLPPNQKLQSDIETLTLPDGIPDAWDTLLDSKSVHKFLYSLKIVDGLLTKLDAPRKEAAPVEAGKEQWQERFCAKEGLAHLFSALLSLPIGSVGTSLARKCFSLLLKVLANMQNKGYSFKKYVRDYEALRGRLTERVMCILDAFAQHSIPSEAEKLARQLKKTKSTVGEDRTAQQTTVQAQQQSPSETALKEKRKMLADALTLVNGFSLIKGDVAGNYEYFDLLMKHGNFKDFILKALILSDNIMFQSMLSEELHQIYIRHEQKAYSETHPHVILIPYMLKELINETLTQDTKCQCFYYLLGRVVKEMSASELSKLPVNFHDQLCTLSGYIKDRKVREHKSTDTDEAITGLLGLTDALLKKFPEEKEFLGTDQGLVYEVMHHCLFEAPKSGSRDKSPLSLPPKCKSQASRQAAFNLLCTLACDTPKNLRQIVEYLVPIHAYFFGRDIS